MRLSHFVFLAMATACVALPPLSLLAQDSTSRPVPVAPDGPPEAPRPQIGNVADSPAIKTAAEKAIPGTDAPTPGQQAGTSGQDVESISGTVVDTNDDLVPGAMVVLEGPTLADRRSMTANDNGFFELAGLKPGIPYRITISANGFVNWTSETITLTPGQFKMLPDIKVIVAGEATSVTVTSTPAEIAIAQVRIEEQQRVFGIIPNFYVSYDPHPVPMTTKLKFRLAFRVLSDPAAFAGAAFIAGINQAADTPDFQQGMKGYGQRMGTVYTDNATDILFGGAILPWLFHQDPRYFYQGTGTVRSRMVHALSNPFICKGDNGKRQPNYSSIGGDVASAALSELYYPASNRGGQQVWANLLISTAERTASSLVQEFLLHKLTHGTKHRP